MKYFIVVLILLVPMNASAYWRQFARVTLETQLKFDLQVELRPLLSQENVYGIRFPAKPSNQSFKSAWLIITEAPLLEGEQDFSQLEFHRKIVVKSKLQVQPVDARKESEIEAKFYYLELSKNILKRAYIYIDFDLGSGRNQYTSGGGYYYTIDLSSFIWSGDTSANK